ncbi:MAG TPA: DUF1971 domain-containing protein [Rhizomicrobium sp.]|nr:DUF1971 domain-containing protein [Rhizomicrobium sp.]
MDLQPQTQPLPPEVRPYGRTGEFSEATVPQALLKAHSTREGAWALIHVVQGKLTYRITDPRRPTQEWILSPETQPGVVEPTILHEVAPLGAVRFYVEFYRQHDGGGA